MATVPMAFKSHMVAFTAEMSMAVEIIKVDLQTSFTESLGQIQITILKGFLGEQKRL